MLFLGIDIGTTSLCAAVTDGSGRTLEVLTCPNDTAIQASEPYARLQDPEKIYAHVAELTDTLLAKYPNVSRIGVSGQMHGILYLDATGHALSPLFYWQDARGAEPTPENADESYAGALTRLTGTLCRSGYGAATHYYNLKNHLVPAGTVGFCTVGDYVVVRLCGLQKPLLHITQAASIGCFDMRRLDFDREGIVNAGMDAGLFPSVTSEIVSVGEYRGRTVYVSVGDNQASFIGSGAGEDGVLINIGTGSQISCLSPWRDPTGLDGAIELRPFSADHYLLVGASLGGGSSFALLERFFRQCAELFGVVLDTAYPVMDRELSAYDREPSLVVRPQFAGTRESPDRRGSIEAISTDNFTPIELMAGFCHGIADELLELYRRMGVSDKTRFVGSGNGLRNNPALCRVLEKSFGRPLEFPAGHEDAAVGAALFAKSGGTRVN